MNAEAILVKIEEDARASAAQTKQDAQAKADEMKAASRAKIEGMQKDMLARAGRDSAAMEERLMRMAELDDRKALLGKKRALIDEAFAEAYQKLIGAPAAQKRAFFLRQIAAYASGNETLIVGAQAAEWFDAAFPAEANEALQKAGKPGKLTLAAEKREGCAGVVLSGGGAEIRCTFDALLEETRAGLEQQVATTLFGEL